jgi:uncharacterized protein (TIGR02466 family)
MKYVGSKQLFPTKIWAFEIEDKASLTPFVKMLYDMREQSLGKAGGESFYYSKGSWQSVNLLIVPQFNALLSTIGENVSVALASDQDDRPVKGIEFKEVWGNINPPNTNIHEHLHIGADYSGVLYLQTPENCGNIRFRDPRLHYETIFQTPDVEINPNVGRMILFPGWLRHAIGINQSNHDRVGIAFNFTITKV